MKIDFEKHFNQKNIDLVEQKMQKYLPELFAQDLVLENFDKNMEIYNYMNSFNNYEIMQILNKYSDLKYEDAKFLCWLAYYIGLKTGLDKNNQ